MKQVCSQDVYNLLKAFNELSSIEEQEEVLDVIYDAFYRRSYKGVIEDRLMQQANQEIDQLRKEVEDLRSENNKLENRVREADIMIHSESKKSLRAAKKGLLIIVGNLKHYLGKQWYTIFPGGSGDVDEFLRKIDSSRVMCQDTWSRYEQLYIKKDSSVEDESEEVEYF